VTLGKDGRVNWSAIVPFGAELHDIDLRVPLPAGNLDELRRLYDEHHLLVFRNQHLSLDEQIRVMEYFGPVLDDYTTIGYVSNVRSDGHLGNSELYYHSDLACTPEPFLGLSLHAVEVEDDATSTRYANAARAYASLPPAIRERIDRLEAVHVWPRELAERQRSDGVPPDHPRAVHPVVMEDPRTHSRALFVNQNQTDAIVGLEPKESEELIQELFRHLYADDNVYEHLWRNGDVVVWDNRAVQHARAELDPDTPRTLQRVCAAHGPAELYHFAGAGNAS
jgi:taurine dioxygenase